MSTLTNDLARLANSANVLVSSITTNSSAITSVNVSGDVVVSTLKTTGGTTATRPAGSAGLIRYNTNTGFVEAYTATGWASFAISSIDYGTVTDSVQTSLDFGGVP